jgi:hypothetical protein
MNATGFLITVFQNLFANPCDHRPANGDTAYLSGASA